MSHKKGKKKKKTLIGHLITTICFDLLDVYPNLTCSTKTFKFINIFPNIERTISQITNHIKYMHSKKSNEHLTNDKFNHHMYKMQFKNK